LEAGTRIVHLGEEHAERVARLYREFGPVVYHRCLRLLRDPEAARDATQEVFVKLLRNAERLTEPDDALPWIYRVATNHCLNQARNERMRRRPAGNDEALALVPAASPELPEGRLAREVLARFDARTQAIAVGVLVDGLEHEELAGALGISRKTVQRTLARFLERARALLAGGEP
jgi:RNA polymerase sigma-70 factor (ECF subfamily)